MELETQEVLINLLDKSYSPYSHIKIAAIVESPEGDLYHGVNVENASIGLSICAERVAMCNLLTSGKRRVSKIYLARYGKRL
jgi:cytidine deaminase